MLATTIASPGARPQTMATDRETPQRRLSHADRPFWARPVALWQGLAFATACVALALMPAVLWRRELSQANAREAAANLAGERSSAALRDRLARVEGAAALRALPILPLELERGAGTRGEPVKQLTISSGTPAIVLALPTDLMRRASAAELRDASDRTLRTVSPLPAGDSDATGLTIAAQLVPSGSYSVVLFAGEKTLARFPFRVIWR